MHIKSIILNSKNVLINIYYIAFLIGWILITPIFIFLLFYLILFLGMNVTSFLIQKIFKKNLIFEFDYCDWYKEFLLNKGGIDLPLFTNLDEYVDWFSNLISIWNNFAIWQNEVGCYGLYLYLIMIGLIIKFIKFCVSIWGIQGTVAALEG